MKDLELENVVNCTNNTNYSQRICKISPLAER